MLLPVNDWRHGRDPILKPEPHLTKSRFIAGRQCERRLWFEWHDPVPHRKQTPAQAAGDEIGRAARLTIPGGVLVDFPPGQHARAVERTRELINDAAVPAIFEGAFEFERTRIRVDILERVSGGQWLLKEVKAGTQPQAYHFWDAAVQAYVLRQCGLQLNAAFIVQLNRDYLLGHAGIDYARLFAEHDVTDEVLKRLEAIPPLIGSQLAVLEQDGAPAVEPSGHCFEPFPCEFWDQCTATKPHDWVFHLPRFSAEKMDELAAEGIEAISEIPEDFPLSKTQDRVRQVHVSGRGYVAPELRDALSGLSERAAYLDFESMMPAVPVYEGTRPYTKFPFQWSLHYRDGGELSHREFLAKGDVDPRRDFCESLIETLASMRPAGIAVYSPYESTTLSQLGKIFPDFAHALLAISHDLVDLLAVVRRHVYLPGFKGSFSIKRVGPALDPRFTYDDLKDTGVSGGSEAASVFERLVTGRLLPGETDQGLRAALLQYCERDTLALVRVHDALQSLAEGGKQGIGGTDDYEADQVR